MNDIQHKSTLCYGECLYSECRDLLNVMVNVVMLNVVMLNVVMLSAVAPRNNISDG